MSVEGTSQLSVYNCLQLFTSQLFTIVCLQCLCRVGLNPLEALFAERVTHCLYVVVHLSIYLVTYIPANDLYLFSECIRPSHPF
jgi:hypothetical protein